MTSTGANAASALLKAPEERALPAPSSWTESSNLDLLRSIAVMFVLVSHLPALEALQLPRYRVQALGFLGVLLFFVHTCLVLMMSLDRQKNEQRGSLTSRFLTRRAFRIYPLSIAVVLFASAQLYLSGRPPSGSQFVSNLLLLQNVTGDASVLAPLWSLPFEMQMYLVLPALYLAVQALPRIAPVMLLALWGTALLLVLALWRARFAYFSLFEYFPCFLPGVLAYSLWHRRGRLSPVVLFGFVAFVAVAFPVLVAKGVSEPGLGWFVCLGLGLILPLCRDIRRGWIGRVAHVVARYSYGIYLVHAICIEWSFVRLASLPPALQWLLFTAGTTILSVVAYRLIESPGIAFGKRLADGS